MSPAASTMVTSGMPSPVKSATSGVFCAARPIAPGSANWILPGSAPRPRHSNRALPTDGQVGDTVAVEVARQDGARCPPVPQRDQRLGLKRPWPFPLSKETVRSGIGDGQSSSGPWLQVTAVRDVGFFPYPNWIGGRTWNPPRPLPRRIETLLDRNWRRPDREGRCRIRPPRSKSGSAS